MMDTERPRDKKAEYRELLGLEHDPDMIVVIPGGVVGRKHIKKKPDGTESIEYTWTPTSWGDDEPNLPPEAQTSGEYGKEYKPGYKARISESGDIVLTAGGGKARAIAGAELYRVFHSPILTLSKYPFVSREEEADIGTGLPKNFWKEYKRYIVETQKVPEEKVLSETESTDTFQGLLEVVKVAHEHGWETPVIISNEYHIPRIKKMWEFLMKPETAGTKLAFIFKHMPKYFKDMMGYHYAGGTEEEPIITFDDPNDFFEYTASMKPVFVSAESILAYRNPDFVKVFEDVKRTDWYQRRVAQEQWGLERLEGAIYK